MVVTEEIDNVSDLGIFIYQLCVGKETFRLQRRDQITGKFPSVKKQNKTNHSYWSRERVNTPSGFLDLEICMFSITSELRLLLELMDIFFPIFKYKSKFQSSMVREASGYRVRRLSAQNRFEHKQICSIFVVEAMD